jgi:hypothetical protein
MGRARAGPPPAGQASARERAREAGRPSTARDAACIDTDRSHLDVHARPVIGGIAALRLTQGQPKLFCKSSAADGRTPYKKTQLGHGLGLT